MGLWTPPTAFLVSEKRELNQSACSSKQNLNPQWALTEEVWAHTKSSYRQQKYPSTATVLVHGLAPKLDASFKGKVKYYMLRLVTPVSWLWVSSRDYHEMMTTCTDTSGQRDLTGKLSVSQSNPLPKGRKGYSHWEPASYQQHLQSDNKCIHNSDVKVKVRICILLNWQCFPLDFYLNKLI